MPKRCVCKPKIFRKGLALFSKRDRRNSTAADVRQEMAATHCGILISGGKRMNIQTIGVLGAGAMGTGIAHVAALNGFQVKIFDEFANTFFT